MAVQAVLVSFTVQDADGDRASIPIYGLYDDATATLSSLAAWVAARAAQLDAVTGSKILSESITLFPALPGGLKGAAVAGNDVERYAHLTWDTASSPVRAYGQDLPGAKDAVFTGDIVNVAQTDMAAWITGIAPPYGTVTPTTERFVFGLTTVRKGTKEFR